MKGQRQNSPCADCAPSSTDTCQCGNGCETCGVTANVRPRFFPGQLLVDGDLQLLTDYSATKGRLHNRFLHGSGVVCGLPVRCHPCGGGKVVVEPGMALDCCGNDIIVPCAVELDINALVRDLRREQLAGYDCGDPCDDKGGGDDAEKNLRRYCLYVNYCEELTDPVTPYVSDDACSSVECEFTRVREGYSFELRCEDESECPPNMWDRMVQCISDLELADKSADDANALTQFSTQTHFASAQISSQQTLPYESADQSLLVSGTSGLNQFTAQLEDGNQQLREIDIRRTMDQLRTTSAAVVRYDLLDDEQKEKAESAMPGLAEQVSAARASVQSAADPLSSVSLQIKSVRDRKLASEEIAQAQLWSSEQLPPERALSAQRQYFAYGVSTSTTALQLMADIATQLRSWLLRNIERRGLFADCKLRSEVLSVSIPTAESNNPQAIAQAAEVLVYAFLRYLIDCICAALNPPCTPCEDTAVKLACVEIEACEVTRICNLERTYVLSWPTMRYWIPFLCEIGNQFERLCCEFPKKLHPGRKKKEQVVFDRNLEYYRRTAPTARVLDDKPAVSNLLRMANINEKSVASTLNIGGNLGTILRSEQVLDLDGKARMLAASGALDLSSGLFSKLGSASFMPAASDTGSVAAGASSDLTARVDDLSEAVRHRLTATTLGATTVVRKLREELEAQRLANEELRKRVDKLAGETS